MATAFGLEPNNDMSSLLACTLCKEELKKPKLLSCQHSFCTQCLEASLQNGDQLLKCPSCNRNVSQDGACVDVLPEDYLFHILKEKIWLNSAQNLQCISCDITQMKTPATHKCLDCGDPLCSTCKDWHCRTSASRNHLVVAIEDMKLEVYREKWNRRKKITCLTHEMDQRLYCEKCECLICNDCMVLEHKQHPVCNWNENMEEKRDDMIKDIEEIAKLHVIHQHRLKLAEGLLVENQQGYDEQKTFIYDLATQLHETIDKWKEEKLTELEDFYSKETSHRNKVVQQERNIEREIAATRSFAVNFLEYSTDVDFLQFRKDVGQRISACKKIRRKTHSVSYLSVNNMDIDFVENLLRCRYGKLISSNLTVLQERRLQKGREIFKFSNIVGQVSGLAVDSSNGNIFATCGSRILVLTNEGQFKTWIQNSLLKKAWDINIKDGYIYVTDIAENERKVIVMDIKGEMMNIFKLPKEDQMSHEALCLTVLKYDHIILSSRFSDTVYISDPLYCTFIPYLTKQNQRMNTPLYLSITTTNDLIVRKKNPCVIQAFGTNKNLRWVYGGEGGNRLGSITGICSDQAGNVYVADLNNPRIQVVKNGELVGIVELGHKVKNVRPLALTKDDELIYGYENNIVKISVWENQ